MKKVYVGNLHYDVTIDEVHALFTEYGLVYSTDLFTERDPGKPHAYAFIEMEDEAAEDAIRDLDGTLFLGLTLRVEAASGQTTWDSEEANLATMEAMKRHI